MSNRINIFKYKLDEEVYTLFCDEIVKVIIIARSYRDNINKGKYIEYTVKKDMEIVSFDKAEDRLYPTKKALLDNLRKV